MSSKKGIRKKSATFAKHRRRRLAATGAMKHIVRRKQKIRLKQKRS